MINYYQPFLLPFLGMKRAKIKEGIKRYYYLSMEDALWDLFAHKLKKGATILIPDFYCMDVIDNIKNHGYTPVFYPVDKHFQTTIGQLKTSINKHNPAAIIIFHACGITNKLLHVVSQTKSRDDILLIEDAVHRIIDPSTVKISGDNHVIGTSLRKVSPLPGSFLYGTTRGLSFPQHASSLFSSYALQSLFYYVLFCVVFILSTIAHIPRLASWSHTYLLKKHDDLIGDAHTPQRNFSFFGAISDWFDIQKIAQKKIHQVNLYEKLFPTTQYLYRIQIQRSDYGNLHAYPIGVMGHPNGLIEYLHSKGIIVWYKFPDSPWSRQQQVLFLPLGFHIRDIDIQCILLTIKQYISQYN